MSRTGQLDEILRSLQSGTPEIEASALISDDGLMIASALPQHHDEVRVAGMSSTLLSLGTRAATELDRGDLHQVLIRGSDGFAVMVKATEGTMLLSLTTADAKLGLIFLEMGRAAKAVNNVL